MQTDNRSGRPQKHASGLLLAQYVSTPDPKVWVAKSHASEVHSGFLYELEIAHYHALNGYF